jgi:hypothetical protein
MQKALIASWPGLTRPSTPHLNHRHKLGHVDARIKSGHDNLLGAFILFFGLLSVASPALAQEMKKLKKPPLCAESAAPNPACGATIHPQFDQDGRLWLTWSQGGHVYVGEARAENPRPSRIIKVTTQKHDIDDNGENRPKLATKDGKTLFVTFTSRLDRPFSGDVFFSRSLDGGARFSPPSSLSDEKAVSSLRFDNLVLADDGNLFAVWLDKRDLLAAKREKRAYTGSAVYWTVSTNNGASFTPNLKLVDSSCECCRIAATPAKDGSISLLWRHVYEGSVRDHQLARLSAGGMIGEPLRPSIDDWKIEACPHHGPGLAVDNTGARHLVWFTDGAARKGLFYAREENGGFSQPLPIGDSTASHPDILSQGDRLYIAWKEFDGEQSLAKIMLSADGGRNWTTPQIMATAREGGERPILAADGKRAYLSWQRVAEGHTFLLISEGKGK